MKRIVLTVIVTFVLSVAASPALGEEMAKEGTGSGKGFYNGAHQILPMGETHVQMNYEGFGIMVNDTGEGLFHNASQHVLGAAQIAKGAIEDSGSIIFTLTSGDKVFMTYKATGKVGKPTICKGTSTIVGGTGKVSGIQGGGEFTRYSLQPPAKGKFASFTVVKSHWKIVEPKK